LATDFEDAFDHLVHFVDGFDVEFDEPTKAKDALDKVKREFGKYIDSDAHSDGKSIYFVVRVK